MIYILIYAYCTVNSGCSSNIHSGHSSEVECKKILVEQDRYWKKQQRFNTSLTCVPVKGMEKTAEYRTIDARFYR